MAALVEELTRFAMTLPMREREMLAERLWESLDEEILELAKKRDHELEQGEVKPVSYEEMMNRLRSNIHAG